MRPTREGRAPRNIAPSETRDAGRETRLSQISTQVSHLASRVSILVAVLTLASCASPPDRYDRTPRAFVGDEIALRAIAHVGKPYRFGGADLDGFDCSGLVYFIHNELGISTPRTAADQHGAAEPVKLKGLAPGDLLFFRTTSRNRITHVGIYAGDGRFVHAPQSGRPIELRALDDDYYRSRLVSAGRLHRDRG
jgi:murein DD-endopeptidase